VTAIAVGAAALIVILSVFNGFEDLVKGLYTDFYADMRVLPAQGKRMNLDDKTIYTIKSIEGVTAVSKVIEEKALLANGDYQSIVVVKGVDSVFTRTNNINKHIVRGSYTMGDLQNPGIVIGAGIENAVGADVTKGGFPLTLYTPNKGAGFDAVDGMFAFNVTGKGVFAVQQEFDNKFIFTNLMLPNEAFIEHIEEVFHNWDDDADMMEQLVLNYIQKPAGVNLLEMIGTEKWQFAQSLLETTIDKKEVAADLIKPKLKNWDAERIALLDMILMRMGVCELLFFETIPTKVTINEYIDLAKDYSTAQSGQFVNGILDNIHKELTESGKIQKVNFNASNNKKK
jgi:transcription antitermination factor NusB